MSERPGDLDVWVLAGQSNMQGCAWLHGALDPDPRIWTFSSAGRWELAAEPLHRLWESFTPVHQELMRPFIPEADRMLDDAELARREATTRKNGAGLGISPWWWCRRTGGGACRQSRGVAGLGPGARGARYASGSNAARRGSLSASPAVPTSPQATR